MAKKTKIEAEAEAENPQIIELKSNGNGLKLEITLDSIIHVGYHVSQSRPDDIVNAQFTNLDTALDFYAFMDERGTI